MNKINLAMLPLAVFAVACGQKSKTADEKAAAQSVTVASSTTSPSGAAAKPPVADAPAAAVTAVEFSIDHVPISNAPLGKFPFFGWPANYVAQNTPQSIDFGHFLFWTGKGFKDVEGQTYMVTLVRAEEKQFSTYELKKNMVTLFQQAGAVKIYEGKILRPALDAIPDATRQELLMGLGDIWNDPVETWVIHRPNDDIWIHYTTNTAQASLAVVQTKPFVATAALLPADQLKSDLDKTGKAVIHVNFATDQTQILPTSKPQMDAVVALLKSDPSLKLAINGYNDDTGSDEHNVTLSDGRAKAVQAALVAAGVKPDRLQAKGYGRMNPVSNNTDEAGKAANRRVELVKL